MKKQILASLVIASLSAGAFALPQVSVEQSNSPTVAADGADRVGPNRVAEGGAERTLERFRVAEDGADRVGPNRVAEGGADRVGINRIAADGTDRVGINRIA